MKIMTVDGNTATAHISYAFSDVAIIYPITPSSPMAELADEWSAHGRKNLFGNVPKIVQMQSEGGVAGALHGALTAGALATTYTCSQGLLLTLPNLYKIAGELLPTVIHVSARTIATHALNIFGDHQDVMACRQTGFAMLASASVQETADMALIAHLSTLKSSIPFIHFFDGFRTSHEYNKIQLPEYDDVFPLLHQEDISRFQRRQLDPAYPVQRGTAQNGDIYFQNRERANEYYLATPSIVQKCMDDVAKLTHRQYRLFDYFGALDGERVVVIMGSGGVTMRETVKKLSQNGEKVGVILVRLYRPFDVDAFCNALPKTCKKIAVLDRTKEAGSVGEPLYLDVCSALQEKELTHIRVVGGRYGLGAKEFTPSMCYAVLQNLTLAQPKNHFTVGINDDLTHTSLDVSTPFSTLPNDCTSYKFYGLGSDGTVGANKDSISIIGDNTDLFVQAYFYYDSKKSGGVTVSHLRFSPSPIHAPYLIDEAEWIACHNPSYLARYDMLSSCKDGGTFLLNCPWETSEELEERLPVEVKRQIAEKRLHFYTINATKIANETGLNGRTSTIMQAIFFLLNPHLLPYNQAIAVLKAQLQKKFAKKGEEVIQNNFRAIDQAKARLQKVDYPSSWARTTQGTIPPKQANDAYFQKVISPILALQGDTLPVSAFQVDGSVPLGTAKFERNGVAFSMPQWIKENCIQCNQCSFVCPHACIRPILLNQDTPCPKNFQTVPAMGVENAIYRMQVVARHCMGCGVCAEVCPAKEKALVMRPSAEIFEKEEKNWQFADTQTTIIPNKFPRNTVKGSQFYPPLFEYSYACAGCGETPYIKVLTQLFGENMVIANSTGCSSIYGGSAPTCPYTVNHDKRGPAWANSLFEDTAEFGLGMRLAYDLQKNQNDEKCVWIIGGDGWAYDIGYGGLDHVLSTNANVNILVLDSEVYSNTGGQVSKATPLGAVARFSALGKRRRKKNLGLMAMTYGYAYVAQVCMGANMQQTIRAFQEANAYEGVSLIIAYCPCIAHGVNMQQCMEEEKRAVLSGYWNLYRFHPNKKAQGENPFILDSKAPTLPLRDFLLNQPRFSILQKSQPELAESILAQAEREAKENFSLLEKLSEGL